MKNKLQGRMLAAMLFLLAPELSHAQGAASFPEGNWRTPEGTIVAIAPCAQNARRFCGVVTAYPARPGAPDAVGFVAVRDLRQAGANWVGRSSDGDAEYGATITERDGRVVLRSCLGPSLCEDETWVRVTTR